MGNDRPPTYEEAVSTSATGSSTYGRPVPRPPPRRYYGDSNPERPSSSCVGSSASSIDTGSLYTSNADLPFRYPRGYFCKKCSNTGYKHKKDRKCHDCWKKFYLRDHAFNPNRHLPFQYPRNFLCEKCENTGFKLKNGKSCKDCWEYFGPRNNYQTVATPYSSFPFSDLMFTNKFLVPAPVPMGQGPSMPPIQVQPGDPRIGGTLCGKCRGSGIQSFFLDEDLCPVCGGLGRIINVPPPPPPQGMPYSPVPPQGNMYPPRPPPPGPPGGYYGPPNKW